MKNEELKLVLDTQFTAVRAMIQANADVQNERLDIIVEQGKIRNHRLEKLECQTAFWRWAQRNRGFSIPVALVLLVGLIWGVVCLGPKKVIEEAIGINIENAEVQRNK